VASLEGALTSLVGLEGVLNPLPADEIPPGIDILRTTVPAINVVGMLPNIDDKEALALALDDGVAAVVATLDAELAVLTKNKEDPTTAKVANSGCSEGLLELLDTAEAALDLLLEIVTHFMSSLVLGASHAEPVQVVVEELTSLVAETTSRSILHDFADALVLEISRSTSKFSQLGSITLVMLLIVEFNSLSRDVRLKSILGIRKFNSSISGHYSIKIRN